MTSHEHHQLTTWKHHYHAYASLDDDCFPRQYCWPTMYLVLIVLCSNKKKTLISEYWIQIVLFLLLCITDVNNFSFCMVSVTELVTRFEEKNLLYSYYIRLVTFIPQQSTDIMGKCQQWIQIFPQITCVHALICICFGTLMFLISCFTPSESFGAKTYFHAFYEYLLVALLVKFFLHMQKYNQYNL